MLSPYAATHYSIFYVVCAFLAPSGLVLGVLFSIFRPHKVYNQLQEAVYPVWGFCLLIFATLGMFRGVIMMSLVSALQKGQTAMALLFGPLCALVLMHVGMVVGALLVPDVLLFPTKKQD